MQKMNLSSAPTYDKKKKKKPLSKVGIEGAYLNITRAICEKPTAISYSMDKNYKHSS